MATVAASSSLPAPPRSALHFPTSFAQLPLRVRPAAWVSDDELFELCQINRDLKIERTAEGEIIVMAPTGGATGNRNFKLTVAFGQWVAKDGTGLGFDSSTGFILPNGAQRGPDAAWVKRERWEALTAQQRERFPPLAPDFVIELRSPSETLDELKSKLAEYIANGVELGWLIDPFARAVHVYRPGEVPQVLRDVDRVSGEPLLPGFVLDLSAIW
ncbi:MAG TPA: Uma2 family endonuclease [Polyangiaceae bacterium]|nr:Uma2 family endonuclease [Polyangiaceae bacterium]